jgi:Ras-related protein Rab-21
MNEHKFKVVLLGEGRVGKTSILLRYIHNSFDQKQTSTFQASYQEKRITIGQNSVELAIWDTAGQERFHALAPIYYRDSNAAILVFDITDRTSFQKVTKWIEELRKIVGKDIVLIIAANKSDLESKRQVQQHDVNEYANSVGAKVMNTSAKSGNGVEFLFLEVTKSLLAQHQRLAQNGRMQRGKSRGPKARIQVVDDDHRRKESSGCCVIL